MKKSSKFWNLQILIWMAYTWIKLKTGIYISNLARDKDNSRGTHWVSFYYRPQCSYGFVPTIEVETKITTYIYNDIDVQNYSSTACGYYCISFIMYMNSQKYKLTAFNAFVQHLSKQLRGKDEILYNLLCN